MGLRSSIALASYNGERYIAEQLDSIARQTRLPDELVVCDDASNDGTSAIVRNFAQQAPFPVLFFQNGERLGSTRNFEKAIRACSGDIIFLCDQDDVWYPGKIALIEASFIDKPEIGAVFTDADVVDENLRLSGKQLWKAFRFSPKEQSQVLACDALSVLVKHPVVTGATMAFRSTYRDLVLPLADTWHDAWISLLIGATSRLEALSLPLIAYRQHGANQLGIPRRGRNRGKTCAEIYGPRVLLYEAVRKRLLTCEDRFAIRISGIKQLEEKLVFLSACASLPEARWRRLPYVLTELMTLRYHRHARGFNTFCRDLLC